MKYQFTYENAIKVLTGLLDRLKVSANNCDKFSALISITSLNINNNTHEIVNAKLSLKKIHIQDICIEDIILAIIPNEFNERNYYLLMPHVNITPKNSNIEFVCSRLIFPDGKSTLNNITTKTTSQTPTPPAHINSTPKISSISKNVSKSAPTYYTQSSTKIICDDVKISESWVKDVISELTNTNTNENKRKKPCESEDPLPAKYSKPNNNTNSNITQYPKQSNTSKLGNQSNKNISKNSKQATMNSFFMKK